IVKLHQIFKLQVGGHLAVIPRWESPDGSLFPVTSKDLPENGREGSSNFFGRGNKNDSDASHPKRTYERKPNLFVRSRNICCYTTGRPIALAYSDKSWPVARSPLWKRALVRRRAD